MRLATGITNNTAGKATAQAISQVLGHACNASLLQPITRSKFTMQMMADIIPDISNGITINPHLGGNLRMVAHSIAMLRTKRLSQSKVPIADKRNWRAQC